MDPTESVDFTIHEREAEVLKQKVSDGIRGYGTGL